MAKVNRKKAAKKAKRRGGVNRIGPDVSKGARAALDAKYMSPEDNLAGNRLIAPRALKQVSDFIYSAEQSRVELNDKLWVLYNMWDGCPISRYVSSARSVHVPEPFKAVESGHVRLVEVLVGPQHWFRVVGDDQEGVKNSENIKDLMEHQLRVDGFRDKFDMIARDTCIYGWCPSKLRWKNDVRKIKYNKVVEKPKMQGSARIGDHVSYEPAEMEIDLSGPTLDTVDVYDFETDLRFRDHNDSPGNTVSIEISEYELLQWRDSGWFDREGVAKMIDGESTPASAVATRGPLGTFSNPALYKDLRESSVGLTSMGAHEEIARRYKIYEYWGKFDPGRTASGKTGTEEEYCIILGRKIMNSNDSKGSPGYTVLSVTKNRWWHGRRPVLVSHYIRRSNCFQSVGLIEPIVKLCIELDDSRNMALEARALAAKPVFVRNEGVELYGENMILDPGSTVYAENPRQDLVALHIPDVTDVAYKSEAVIKADIHETTGIIKMFEGSGGEQGETATATVNRIRQANKRIAGPARTISETFIVPMLEQMHAMNQQCLNKEKMVEILGEDGLSVDIRKITPASIMGRVHFEVITYAEIEMVGVEGDSLIGFLNAAAPYVQNDPEVLDATALLEIAFEKKFGTRHLSRIFPASGMPKKMRTPYEEHLLIANGNSILMPQQGEKVRAHLNSHIQMVGTETFRSWPEDYKRVLLSHIENTKIALQRKVEEMIPDIPQQPGMGAPPPQQGGRPAPGARPPRTRPPAGTTGEARSIGARASPRPPARPQRG